MSGTIAENGEAGSPTPRKWPKSRYLDDKSTNCRASSQAPLGFGILRRPTSSNPWSRTTTYTQIDFCIDLLAAGEFIGFLKEKFNRP